MSGVCVCVESFYCFKRRNKKSVSSWLTLPRLGCCSCRARYSKHILWWSVRRELWRCSIPLEDIYFTVLPPHSACWQTSSTWRLRRRRGGSSTSSVTPDLMPRSTPNWWGASFSDQPSVTSFKYPTHVPECYWISFSVKPRQDLTDNMM